MRKSTSRETATFEPASLPTLPCATGTFEPARDRTSRGGDPRARRETRVGLLRALQPRDRGAAPRDGPEERAASRGLETAPHPTGIGGRPTGQQETVEDAPRTTRYRSCGPAPVTRKPGTKAPAPSSGQQPRAVGQTESDVRIPTPRSSSSVVASSRLLARAPQYAAQDGREVEDPMSAPVPREACRGRIALRSEYPTLRQPPCPS